MPSWKRMSVGLKLSLGATLILALDVVGVLANHRFGSQDDAVQAWETGGTDAEKPGDDVKLAGKPLELGTDAKISPNYRIAVTAVSKFETEHGQLVVPTIRATYIGTGDGEPWADLNVELHGLSSKTFGESDCPAGLGHADATEQPTLYTGDDDTYDVCIAVPTKSVKGGKILVEEAFSTDDPTFWSIKGAVTKTLPSVAAPPATNAPATGFQPRRQPANRAPSREACEDFDEDKYEEYKDWGENLKDQYEARKDSLDDDEVDDFKDWEDDYDQVIDYYEKLDEACD